MDPALFSLLPVETAANLLVLPLKLEGDTLHVAVADPLNLGLEQRLSAITGHDIAMSVAEPDFIQEVLKRSDSSRRMLDNVSRAFRPEIVREDPSGDEKVLDLDALQDQSGVVPTGQLHPDGGAAAACQRRTYRGLCGSG